jgi:hypothetical protein
VWKKARQIKIGTGLMTNAELNKVCRWINEGGKLMIGRDASGHQKIKIIHGPLGMFVHRFLITDSELENLKAMILTHMQAAAA